MRKNLNKVIAFAIGVSVISGSVVPAMAADSTSTAQTVSTTQASAQKTVLSLDDAIKAAVANSDKLKLYDEKIRYLQNKNSLTDKKFDFMDDIGQDVDDNLKDYTDNMADATLDQVEQQRDFEKDSVAYKTTNAYNNLVSSQISIDDTKKAIQVQESQLNNSKLKQQLGMATSLQIEGAELDLQKAKNVLQNSENALKDAKDSFKVLTGKNVDDHILDQNIKYDKFQIDGSEDEYIDGVIEQYMSYNEQLLEINKEYWNDSDTKDQYKLPDKPSAEDLASDAPKLIASGKDGALTASDVTNYIKKVNGYQSKATAYINAISSRMTYLETKYNLKEQENTLNESKKSLKEGLKTMYTNLLNVEKSIDLLNNSIELKNKQLRIAKTQYDLGLTTKLDYDTAVNDADSLNTQLRTLIIQYNQLKEQIEKPWLMSSGNTAK